MKKIDAEALMLRINDLNDQECHELALWWRRELRDMTTRAASMEQGVHNLLAIWGSDPDISKECSRTTETIARIRNGTVVTAGQCAELFPEFANEFREIEANNR